MYKFTKLLASRALKEAPKRTFLSHAYYCDEPWQKRLNSPIIQKVNLDILYFELDQRFQKTRQMSAVDVDIFVNAIADDAFIDEAMDLVHKLRLTAETGATLASTPHAVIRLLLKNDKIDELLRCLDDRLNYGLFLDDHTANILLDSFWKSKNHTAGAFVSSQVMLQEDFRHPITASLSLLHCYNYLLAPGAWPEQALPAEPEEEVKVRVKYLRNPYDDRHFDLRDPGQIVGKTLASAAGGEGALEASFRVLGLALLGDEAGLERELASGGELELVAEILQLAPESDSGAGRALRARRTVSQDVQAHLARRVRESVAVAAERDIADQCGLYERWEGERVEELERQRKRVETVERLAEVARMKQALKEREERLWFFENEEQVELQISEREANAPKQTKAKAALAEEEYVPPEIRAVKST